MRRRNLDVQPVTPGGCEKGCEKPAGILVRTADWFVGARWRRRGEKVVRRHVAHGHRFSAPAGRPAFRRFAGTWSAVHGDELLRIGLTVGQVVQEYGSICESVTELVHALFHDATAQAVTEYERQRDQKAGGGGEPGCGSLSIERLRVYGDAAIQKAERISVAELIEEIEIVPTIEAKQHESQLSIDGARADRVEDECGGLPPGQGPGSVPAVRATVAPTG